MISTLAVPSDKSLILAKVNLAGTTAVTLESVVAGRNKLPAATVTSSEESAPEALSTTTSVTERAEILLPIYS